jgi:hypothetical protein
MSRSIIFCCVGLLATAAIAGTSTAQTISRRPIPWQAAPTDIKSLEKFLLQCQLDGKPFKLSLKLLAEEWIEGNRVGRIPKAVETLRGFTWFFGFLVDRERDDVYLLGLVDTARPPIDFDCLVTALRAVHSGEAPFCSLDRHTDPKLQKTVIGGVDWKTRWAEIMVEADYDMKKMAIGEINTHVRGLTSWFDRKIDFAFQGGDPMAPQVNRWWFSRNDVPRTLIIDSPKGQPPDLVLLLENPVVVLTEEEVDGKYGTGAVTKEAKDFANSMTKNLSAVGQSNRPIAQLLSLYRLLDLAVHLHVVGGVSPPKSDFWFTSYSGSFNGPPKSFPTVRRTRLVYDQERSRVIEIQAMGGVQMLLNLSTKQYPRVRSDDSLKSRMLRMPEPDSPEGKEARLKALAHAKAERDERSATMHLSSAHFLLKEGNEKRAIQVLMNIIADQPGTKGAAEAEKLLNDL